jgi:hypothetical protein
VGLNFACSAEGNSPPPEAIGNVGFFSVGAKHASGSMK